jgi:hypothetical protein
MFNPLKAIFNWAKKVFTKENVLKAETAINKYAPLLFNSALPAVELVAAMTPNKTDDEIVALLESLKVTPRVDLTRPLSDLDKNGLLKDAAVSIVQGDVKTGVFDLAAAAAKAGLDALPDTSPLLDAVIKLSVEQAYTYAKVRAGV